MTSLTPDPYRKVGMGVAPSPSPFFTPRPERRRVELRGVDWNSNRQDRDKEVNVQVLLRCRPLTDEEKRLNVAKVMTCNELKREVTVQPNIANKQTDRVFTFDKVFGPKAQQRSMYDQAISPIVREVLEGFNCTVFAYGQTGTGKTYTMEGEMRNKGGELPAEAGIIPRAVRQIFDTLESQNADYSMKVTFLELYNEEITDLLAPEDYLRSLEERQKKPISLMEDSKGCVVVRGLEEEAVYSANEIYNLLERGATKRRTADTLLNKRSSRSHSVFTITVYIKEGTVGDEDLIKCGKLNLVDLAGSENISRSGAREARAREAGEINKSLLTLGRVINALVEHSVHVPYRDSKLTRLLRDSLGGKTKTCIIATISPSAQCLDETLGTLDYAYRAKNIKNKPEANQKMCKAVLLKDLYLELERMKQDVRAAREKNGVYIPHEKFSQDEAEKKAKNEKIEQLEIDLNDSEKQVVKYRELYSVEQEEKLNFESELKDCKTNLENCNKALQHLQEEHKIATSMLKEKEFIISKLLHSENCLIEHAKELRFKLCNASEDISTLFTKIDHRNRLEVENQGLLLTFGSQLDQSLKDLHKTILGSVSQQQQQLRCMEEHVSSFIASKRDVTQVLKSRINKMAETYASGISSLKELSSTLQLKASSDLEQMKSALLVQITAVEKFFDTAVSEAKDVICDMHNSLNEQTQILALSTLRQEEGLHRSMVSANMISKAAFGFFNDINDCAFNLSRVIEQNLVDNAHQLATLENTFKERAIIEEKIAMEKIAAILAALTTKQTTMVSEASKSIRDLNSRENKIYQQEMSKVQKISVKAKKGLSQYVEKVNSSFYEEIFTSAETRATMEDRLQECSTMVDHSWHLWEKAQLSINHLNKIYSAEIASTAKEKICEHRAVREELVSTCSAINAEYEAEVIYTQEAIKDSLLLDHKNKEEVDSMTVLCLEQLNAIRDKHGESISNLRNRAEKCLKKDYLVDHQTIMTPKRQVIEVPSLDSIEQMRTPAFKDLIANIRSENRPIWHCAESKIPEPQLQSSLGLNRTPFADVN